ncbi:hypothetical protein, unlikely [Trypanosoma brucei brucei TREU927]|uniref:Uncharacterized protein n=1 Tax=Trypanosoma brucei brucei (strain 927/4 GUTat10.1) TaxID=185431 RepID=Q38E39_TRYB2|nr:hypothetical protein, unlikely [Trypanosoma brucei brucei TREU927]EAN76931.1 hypothetical protein, unlikely [Trypanosoma brucei brucei TREU927]
MHKTLTIIIIISMRGVQREREIYSLNKQRNTKVFFKKKEKKEGLNKKAETERQKHVGSHNCYWCRSLCPRAGLFCIPQHCQN